MFGHAPHANRQRHGHHSRQALGNGGHGQCHGGHGGLGPGQAPHVIQHKNHADDATGNGSELFAQRVELALQGGFGVPGAGNHAGKLAHLGAHAGLGHQQFSAAPGEHRVHEQQVEPVTQRQVSAL